MAATIVILEGDIDVTRLPRSCAAAKATGSRHYFTGRPCPNGHTAARFTSNNGCEECLKAQYRARYAADPEPFRERARRYAKHDPEGNRRRSRGWYARLSPERRQEITAASRERHAAARLELNRRWAAANPTRIRAYRRTTKARRRGAQAGDVVTAQEWMAIKEAAGGRCLRCGRAEPEITLTQDHVVPLSRGGRHRAENLQPLCGRCNRIKAARTIDYRMTT